MINAKSHEFWSNAVFGAVLLNPDFAVNDVAVNQGAVDAPLPLPADFGQQVMIVFLIDDEL